jgi:hypothetical protein
MLARSVARTEPGGPIAIAEQPQGAQYQAETGIRGDYLVKQLADAGFHRVGFTSESLMALNRDEAFISPVESAPLRENVCQLK